MGSSWASEKEATWCLSAGVHLLSMERLLAREKVHCRRRESPAISTLFLSPQPLGRRDSVLEKDGTSYTYTKKERKSVNKPGAPASATMT